ncbi:hypothetical protein ACEYYB_05090 [Paracoccus sp. p4-l81]|uniref:hypothetical protein n=1 Tax=Paracoccus sp. p4-l81 TaxID=3342806 RepID=UPI0035B7587B
MLPAMMPRRAPVMILALALAACGGTDADYPRLVPMDALLADPAAAVDPVAVQAELGAGASGLRARASALRGPVIDTATRARMQAMRSRHR